MAKKREYIGRVTGTDGRQWFLSGSVGGISMGWTWVFTSQAKVRRAFKYVLEFEDYNLGPKPKLRVQEITEEKDG